VISLFCTNVLFLMVERQFFPIFAPLLPNENGPPFFLSDITLSFVGKASSFFFFQAFPPPLFPPSWGRPIEGVFLDRGPFPPFFFNLSSHPIPFIVLLNLLSVRFWLLSFTYSLIGLLGLMLIFLSGT